jgi:hypothetical protein
MSKITGHGCDVVDRLGTSNIALDFPHTTRSDPAEVAASPEEFNVPDAQVSAPENVV